MNLNKLLLIIISLSSFQILSVAQDVTGSKDHPMITRYPGSFIGYYEEQKYFVYNVAAGPQTAYKNIDEWIKIEGKFTRIYYILKGETTVTEVFRNYMSAFESSGFKIIAEGVDDKNNVSQKVGGRVFLNTFYEKNPFPSSESINLLKGTSTAGGTCYIAAQLEKPGSNVYIVIGGSQYSSGEKVFLVDIIESSVMEDDLIKITAEQMLKGLQAEGRIAVYGVYFDVDKSDVKPESKPALEEMTKLLNQNPELKVYIVGHTDMTGTLEHNMNLSLRRAESIVKELVSNYGIELGRLTAQGVGPLSPVSTNKTDAGKKLNRRVEIVEK